MTFLGDLGDESNDGVQETILEKVVFYRVRDAECGVVGWRIQHESFGITVGSLRIFDTLSDATQDFLEDFKENEPPIA